MSAPSLTAIGIYTASISGTLTVGADGTLYGVAGGGDLSATIFSFAAGSFTTLATFNDYAVTGGTPWGGVFVNSASNVYSTSPYGGTDNGVVDVVSALDPIANPLTALASTAVSPEGPPVVDAAGDVFFAAGGTAIDEVKLGSGVVTPFASISALGGNLTIDSSGNIYGITSSGGQGYGSVFEVSPTGTVTTLVAFTGVDGDEPQGQLVMDAAGNLYGNAHNLFEIAAGTHAFTVLADFSDGGASETNQIAVTPNGTIYGTTTPSVSNVDGTVYQLVPQSDTITTLLSDADSVGGLTAAVDGDVFGASGDQIFEMVPCFLEGTRIAGPDGERAVETLGIGDLILTVGGAAEPVKWIGRRVLHASGKGGYCFADPLVYKPICIRAGALDEKLPTRDLFVSPDHGILIDDLLVQAATLVNGISILRQVKLPETFTYFHIELADHALVLAEGVASETFVDNVTRMGFDNWHEHEALYPHAGPIAEMDLPRVQAQRQLPLHIHEQMQERARAMLDAAGMPGQGIAA